MLGVVAAERVAGVDARARRSGRAPASTGASSAHRELAHDRRLVQQLDAVDRGQRARARRRCAAPAARRARRSPRLPEPGEVDDRPPSAFSAWAVQMLWVAFSRRMCCSRVCSVSTKPRRPSTSVGLAGDPARHAADVLLGRAEEAERGAAEVEPVAERLALADGDVGAALARRLAGSPSVIGSTGDDHQRAVLLGRRAERLDVLDRAEEVRLLQEDRGGLVVDRVGERRRRR